VVVRKKPEIYIQTHGIKRRKAKKAIIEKKSVLSGVADSQRLEYYAAGK
jgi:hypothetical protein